MDLLIAILGFPIFEFPGEITVANLDYCERMIRLTNHTKED